MTTSASSTLEIGNTGAVVSRLALGGGPLGNLLRTMSDETATDVVRSALDARLRLFDTAPVYGMGLAEQRLGRALAGVDRDTITISTKVGRLLRRGVPREEGLFHDGVPFFHDTPDLNTIWDFSYRGAMLSLEESLDRLGQDRADIVYLHEPPPEHVAQAARDAYRALRELRSAGAARAIGVGSDRLDVLAALAGELEVDCILLANRYSLLDQSALESVLPLCVEHGITVLAGGVFNSGILADPLREPTFDYLPADAEVRARVRAIHDVCRAWNAPPKAAALQFPLLHPAVVSVVVGMRSAEETAENVEMLELEIPSGLWRDLKRRRLIAGAAPTPA